MSRKAPSLSRNAESATRLVPARRTCSGSVAGFSYSDANKNSGIVWSEETFAEYIKDPRAKIPGTKMIFAGIKNEQEIKDLWAYIKQFDAEGNIKK
jgi:cytochrome c